MWPEKVKVFAKSQKLDYVADRWNFFCCICVKGQIDLLDVANSIWNLKLLVIPALESYLILIHALELQKLVIKLHFWSIQAAQFVALCLWLNLFRPWLRILKEIAKNLFSWKCVILYKTIAQKTIFQATITLFFCQEWTKIMPETNSIFDTKVQKEFFTIGNTNQLCITFKKCSFFNWSPSPIFYALPISLVSASSRNVR